MATAFPIAQRKTPSLRIGIDLMGSDSSPDLLFEAVKQSLSYLHPEDSFIIFGTDSVIDILSSAFQHPSIYFEKALFEITADDDPIATASRKKDSSLAKAMQFLGEKKIDALVSAGNTGAMVVSAKLFLEMLPGIHRPALLATLPTKKGIVAVIDVGGNVLCKTHHLIQFALMGAAYQTCCHHCELPKVGLLNIGVEFKKGTPEVREAYQKLKSMVEESTQPPFISFEGNVEGREAFQGMVDVLVTDGFSGNVLLKTAEGIAEFIFSGLNDAVKQKWPSEILQDLTLFQQRFSYAEYPGAVLCGVDGVVVKCHGRSSVNAFCNGIIGAMQLVRKGYVPRIKELLLAYKA